MAWFPLGVTAAATEDASTTVWVNAVIAAGGTVSTPQRGYVDTLIKAYKAAGVWNLLDHEWLFAAENVKCAQIDIKGLASHTPISLGHFPSFVTNRGYEIFSDDGYIDLGFAPSSGVNYQQNTASFGIYILMDRTFTYPFSSMGTTDNSSFSFMRPFNTAGIEYDINSSAFNTAANTTSTTQGSYLFSRINSTTIQPYRNDVALAAGTTAPALARSTYNWYLFTYNGAGAVPGVISDDQIAACFTGGALNNTQALAKQAALNAYMTSVGCNVYGPLAAPINTAVPVISGTTNVGQTLSASNGTWTGTAITYAYQWKRGGADIAGATANTYLLVTADLATNITVAVTASNSGGAVTAVSASVGPIAASGTFNPSSRSSININGADVFSYMLIDHFKQGDNFLSPIGGFGGFSTLEFPKFVDANGWVNKDDAGGTTGVNTQVTGGGFRIPATTSFGGPYILEWTGNATVQIDYFPYALTWVPDNTTALGDTSSTYTYSTSGRAITVTNKPGQNALAVIKPSGTNGPVLISVWVTSTGPTPFMTNLRFYRFEDRADLLAGKIFRTGWKQNIINLNPHHVRLLDWSTANAGNIVRFEHRTKPSYTNWFFNYAGMGQPAYGSTSLTASNQYSLAAVSGTPGTYQHGELVTCHMPAAQRPAQNSGYTLLYLADITVAANATVTVDTFLSCQHVFLAASSLTWSGGVVTVTTTPHGYTTGMVLELQMASANVAGYNSPAGRSDTCTITSSTQFTYARVTNPGSSATFSYVRGPAVISGITWSGGNATVTTTNNLLYTTGSVIPMKIEGASPAGYNGEYSCTVISANTFRYALVTNPGSASTRGAISSHGRPNGESMVIVTGGTINVSTPVGMTQIDRKAFACANGTATTFQTGINSSTFNAFTVGQAYNNLTLDVGGRGPRAVVLDDGSAPVTKYHNDTLGNVAPTQAYITFTFDATLRPNTGVVGGWVVNQSGTTLFAGCPPEIAAALVNELMAMNPLNPIHLYVTMATMGLCSLDPDYTTASDWAANYIDVIINPASTNRAAGYSALDSRCTLFVEHSNETWNFGASYLACYYQSWRGYLLRGIPNLDINTYSTTRAVMTVRDIKTKLPPASFPRIKYVLGMFSAYGYTVHNDIRINGNSDISAIIGATHPPMYDFDYANFAGYFNIDEGSGSGFATPPAYQTNVNVANWQAAIPNQAAMDAVYLNYNTGIRYQANGGTSTIEAALTANQLGGSFGLAPALAALGKATIGYEGGWQCPENPGLYPLVTGFATFTNGSTAGTYVGGSGAPQTGWYVIGPGIPPYTTATVGGGTFTMSAAFTGTTGQSYYVTLSPKNYFWTLCRGHSSWATIHRAWFDGAAALGQIGIAEFIIHTSGVVDWSHTFYQDTYIGSNEAAGLDADIIAQGNRNRGL